MMLLGIVFLLVYREWRDALVSWREDAGEPWKRIRKQEETLQKLNAKTWGVEFVQDGNRKFLVLPYGKSAEVIPFQGKEWVHLKE
ncbi:hypothetical protein AB2H94_27025 (plasmid) [Escherichia coli]